MFDFHASDFGTRLVPNSKYYWQNEKAKCCILVPDSSKESCNTPVEVHFLQLAPQVTVFCNDIRHPDGSTVAIDSTESDCAASDVIRHTQVLFERVDGKCSRPKNCGKILNSILDLIDKNSWSFPRAKASEPYISRERAEMLESSFKTMVTAPDNGTCIYASVATAGTMLANRIGIKPIIEFQVSHYDMSTNTQDDNLIDVSYSNSVDVLGRTVIVIDDLISSGRTANAVIQSMIDAGAAHIYYFALYRTICSQEVELCSNPRVTIQSYIPISNAYWTYGRGFDLTDEESRNLPDIYGSTKHWDWESEQDVNELILFFNGKYQISDYR